MYKLLIFTLLFLFHFGFSTQIEECPLHLNCNSTIVPGHNDSYVENYCLKNEGNMSGRCCISNNIVVGLDLRECQLKRLNISNTDFENLTVFDLRENELDKVTPDDLLGFTLLEDLYLPSHIHRCPGGKAAWESVSHEHNMTHCFHEEDPCVYLNVSCTDFASCSHTGPGTARCVCHPGRHGYKCLNQGYFPSTAFAFSVVIPAVVLSVVVWFVQGRDVYKTNTL